VGRTERHLSAKKGFSKEASGSTAAVSIADPYFLISSAAEKIKAVLMIVTFNSPHSLARCVRAYVLKHGDRWKETVGQKGDQTSTPATASPSSNLKNFSGLACARLSTVKVSMATVNRRSSELNKTR